VIESRIIDRPQQGFYVIRLVKGGPLVPARIWRPCACTVPNGDDAIDPNALHEWRETCDRFPHLRGEIDGKHADLWMVWTSGRPTTEANWRYMTDVSRWARAHAPHEPEAQPRETVNLAAIPPIF